MKLTVVLALSLSAVPFPVVAAVEPGASLAEVRDTLGSPAGEVRRGERHVLYYAHGSVELVDGRVARVALRSPEEQAAVAAREERVQAGLAARRARSIEEGTALRDRKLAEPAFQAVPVAYQVSFWDDFARRYPDVSCVEPRAIARAKLAEELAAKRIKEEEIERLARIEERLAAAEREPRVQTRIIYRGRHDRHQEFALWPVSYTFYEAPLPVYSSPTGSPVNPFKGDVAQPERRDNRRPEAAPCGDTGWRKNSRDPGSRRGRM